MGSIPILATSKMLKFKTSFITGGSRGIGRKIIKDFSKNGSDVAFTYFSSFFEYKSLKKKLYNKGIKSKGYKFDVSIFYFSEIVINDILNIFGDLDILVNNAGIVKDDLLVRMKEKYWDIVINVNLKSIFNILKFLSKNFIKQKKGSIINISSIIALKGNIGQSNYAASKSGIIGFSKSISIELGSKNIRSNVICPGIINTSMTKYSTWNIKNFINSNIFLKRIGRVEDISSFVIFLASDKSSYVTGQVIQIDGGL